MRAVCGGVWADEAPCGQTQRPMSHSKARSPRAAAAPTLEPAVPQLVVVLSWLRILQAERLCGGLLARVVQRGWGRECLCACRPYLTLCPPNAGCRRAPHTPHIPPGSDAAPRPGAGAAGWPAAPASAAGQMRRRRCPCRLLPPAPLTQARVMLWGRWVPQRAAQLEASGRQKADRWRS